MMDMTDAQTASRRARNLTEQARDLLEWLPGGKSDRTVVDVDASVALVIGAMAKLEEALKVLRPTTAAPAR